MNYSPLRYPGGKTSLFKYLARIIDNNLPINTYIEPYAGGAGAALALLFNGYVNNIILNDADVYIFQFWNAILNEKNRFIQKIRECPVDIDTYQIYKHILRDHANIHQYNELDIGFTTFYLNRCNRSGILRSGPIGGYNQEGKWKIDARFNKEELIMRINKIYEYRNQISFFNADAIDFLRDTIPQIGIDLNSTLIYLDPPYYEQGPLLYRTYYKKSQHTELKDFLYNLNTKWVLSYDDVQEINELYEGIRVNGYLKSHFANKAKIGKELIIVSDDCILPDS